MFKLREKVTVNGIPCFVVGKKYLDFGKGPLVYELVAVNQYPVYRTKPNELKSLALENSDRSYVVNIIAHVPDERLRNITLDENTSEEDIMALSLAPLVGFTNVPEDRIEKYVHRKAS